MPSMRALQRCATQLWGAWQAGGPHWRLASTQAGDATSIQQKGRKHDTFSNSNLTAVLSARQAPHPADGTTTGTHSTPPPEEDDFRGASNEGLASLEPTRDELALVAASERNDVLTVAMNAGMRLTGKELEHLAASFNTVNYPDVPAAERMYPDPEQVLAYLAAQGVDTSTLAMEPSAGLEALQLDLIRRNSISMPCKENQRVFGTVFAVGKNKVYVDVGHTTLAEFSPKELSVANLVGTDEPAYERQSAHDVREGDRFVFRITDLKSPLGSVWLEPQRPPRSTTQEQVWAEMRSLYQRGKAVHGRILNQVTGGYAVGIAGFVGVLPFTQSSPQLCRQLGVLQRFFITAMDDYKHKFNVMHPTSMTQPVGGNRMHPYPGRPSRPRF